MKNVFKKSNLQFIKNALHRGSGRDRWTLARMMQDSDGLQHQLPAEISLLQKGAASGDVWSTCELARTYFSYCGDIFLPHALACWRRAALLGDGGARSDIKRFPILSRIASYRSFDGDSYKEIEMKCAMLTEWHLFRVGYDSWDRLDSRTKKARCTDLVRDVCGVLHIPNIEFNLVPRLSFRGGMVDGLAYWEGRIDVREELLYDVERLIEVIFHELGHLVTFEIRKATPNSAVLKRLFGITDARVRSWERGDKGIEISTSEEDADTLSYGVYTVWATFFLNA